jgi:hypothetical protein
MKVRLFYWFLALTVPLACRLGSLLHPAKTQARIKVEDDVTDIPGMTSESTHSGFDPYFMQVNRCDHLFTPKSNSNKNQQI